MTETTEQVVERLARTAIKRPAECVHEEEAWYCASCKYEWEKSLVNRVQAALREALRIGREQQRWISVEEQLPEDANSVLIAYDGNVTEACYEGTERGWELIRTDGYDETIHLYGEVTHWRPLPDPPPSATCQRRSK